MGSSRWRGRLTLRYRRDGERTTAHDQHEGPLRVLQRLYPEGPGICHHVLVHPPGGIVGGDELVIDAHLDAGTHALLTTPGATRFYRSAGALATQTVTLAVGADARLEWLPLETIAFDGCHAENRLRLDLAPGAEAMGWEMLALGLPASGRGFERGRYVQQIEWPGVWRERGVVDATDRRLLDSPLGWAGQRVLATLWFAAGSAPAAARREQLLDVVRSVVDDDPLRASAGASAPHDRVFVLRVLAPRVEPAFALLQRARAAWRQVAWGLEAQPSRLWRT